VGSETIVKLRIETARGFFVILEANPKPYAELILRGMKTTELCSTPTKIVGQRAS
jgi:hypothetical protein